MAVVIEDRVTNLEQLMAQLTQNVDRLSQEMREFKDEMREFKDEMNQSRDESQKEWRKYRQDLGEISRKMGTLAEDMVAPSIPRILRVVLECSDEKIDSAVRVRRYHRTEPGRRQEFDVVATCGRYLLINETKNTLRPEDIKDFVQKTLPTIRDFFPEHVDKKVIGVIASLYVDESLVHYGERQGLIVLGFGEDLMDVLNSPDFRPNEF